jgi:hypothetical protein
MRPRLTIAAAALPLLALAAPSHAAGGGVWTPTLPATSAFDNLSAFPDGTAYATVGTVTQASLGIDAHSVGFFKSTDFGQTWAAAQPPAWAAGSTATTNLYVRFATSAVGYATYNAPQDLPRDPTGHLDKTLCTQLSSTFRTTDGGAHWTALCEPRLPDGRAFSPAASPLAVAQDGRTVLMAGFGATWRDENDCDVPLGGVAFSTDAGTTWRQSYLPKGWSPGWMVRAYDSRTAAVVAYWSETEPGCGSEGTRNGVFVTHDSGRTWRLALDCPTQPLCASVAFVTRDRLLVGHTDGTMHVSDDGGLHWRHAQRLYDEANDSAVAAGGDPDQRNIFWVQAMSFADGVHGYASTRGAGTWRTDDGGRHWVQERSHECAYYPFGVGDNATATTDVSVTGGPGTFSARSASPAPAGPCHPPTVNLPLPSAVAATTPLGVLRLDGTIAS